MKRLISMILSLCLVLSLAACGAPASTGEEVSFYYVPADFDQRVLQGAMASEPRDISGHTDSLTYLITLYLTGPMSQDLEAVFPDETRLLSLETQKSTLRIRLTEMAALSESQFSLGAACLAMTCFPLTDAYAIQLESGNRSIRLLRDSLFLEDNVIETIEGGTP